MSLALAGSVFRAADRGLAIDHLGTRLAFGLLTLGPLLSAGGLYLLRRQLAAINSQLLAGARKPSAAA